MYNNKLKIFFCFLLAISHPSAFAQTEKSSPPLDPKKLEAPLPKNLFIELSKLINPAVVFISTTQKVNRPMYRDPMQDFLEEFMGRGRGFSMQPQPVQALGTGFIIKSNGLIITNNHVIEKADEIKVKIMKEPIKALTEKASDDANTYTAKVIGRDARTDIALIKIEPKSPLPVAPLGSSKDLEVGEWVAAFGNPYGHEHTMTKGIISAIGREIGEINRFPFIQTDASINPGNSGGPLVNTQGYVIGVNTAIDARAQGIGFAIPIDNVKSIITELEENGKVKRGYIGVGLGQLSPEIAESLGLENAEGVVVTQIMKDSPAAQAGIQKYDIIAEFGVKKIQTAQDLSNAVADTKIGSRAKVKIIRIVNEKAVTKSLDLIVRENPAETKVKTAEVKKVDGQKAPFNLGFQLVDHNEKYRQDFGTDNDAPIGAIVSEVTAGSIAQKAGLQVGDVITDVNRKSLIKVKDIFASLQQGRNILSVARGSNVFLMVLDTRNK